MSSNITSTMNEKELFKIARDYVLPNYNLKDATIEQIKIKDTLKHRAVYKISSGSNTYCLKKIYYTEDKLLFMYSVLEWLHRSNFNVPKILKTKNNNICVNINGLIFILTPWIPGTKCDLDNIDHISKASKNLALLHQNTKEFFPIQGSFIKEGYANLYISINKHFNNLLSSFNSANKRKDSFSKIFLSTFDENIELAKFALYVSSTINFDNLSRSICHGDYVNKNLLLTDNKISMIDFDKCSYDYSMTDLSYFLRRLLKRNDTKWDFDIAKKIIISYNKINKLTEDDIKYIMVYLAFPQKYWRISRDYYSSISKCNKNASREALLNTNEKTLFQVELVSKAKVFFANEFNIYF